MSLLKEELRGFVPVEQAKGIIEDIAYQSATLKLSDVKPMSSDKKKFSVLTEGCGAYWVDETKQIKTSKASWIFPEMEAKKLGVIIPVPREKIEDTTINVFEEFKKQIAEAFAQKIDEACLFGIDTPFSHSILSAAKDSKNEMEALKYNQTIDLDASDLMGLIEDKGFDPSAFVANTTMKNKLRKLRDGNGNQLYVDGVDGKEFYNVPIEFLNHNVKNKDIEMLTGNFKDYSLVGIRSGIRYEILTESTLNSVQVDGQPLSLAENDCVAIKATMRLGFLPVKSDAFAVLTASKSAGKAPKETK